MYNVLTSRRTGLVPMCRCGLWYAKGLSASMCGSGGRSAVASRSPCTSAWLGQSPTERRSTTSSSVRARSWRSSSVRDCIAPSDPCRGIYSPWVSACGSSAMAFTTLSVVDVAIPRGTQCIGPLWPHTRFWGRASAQAIGANSGALADRQRSSRPPSSRSAQPSLRGSCRRGRTSTIRQRRCS